MDISAWPDSELKAYAEQIDRLGLARNVYELELYGLTVVDASVVQADDLVDRAYTAVLDLMEERNGVRPDEAGGSTHVGVITPTLYHFMHENEVFEQMLVHPVAYALAATLVGARCVLSSTQVFMKGPASADGSTTVELAPRSEGLQLGLHSDNIQHPEPFTEFAEICNVTWALSDYTRELGALAFVPGSHRFCRQPVQQEGARDAVPVECPRGSLIAWHGNTWHGSYPRTVPGLRTALSFQYTRSYIWPQEDIRSTVTKEMLDRNPPLFAQLVGEDLLTWDENGPDYEKFLKRPLRPTTFT